ncbi:MULTISPECIES: hypothetical protein [Streptomyces]|uniref:Uncharacterized protein n=1 Tax=Streptomyces achmelvichensis TaxID=3134111 RepID=A0ACC6PLC4_9ACTN|nr:hypothetical protein [Streptomyces sp. NBC_00306]
MDHRTRTWYDEPTDLADWDSLIGPLAAQIEARFSQTCCQPEAANPPVLADEFTSWVRNG